MELVIVIALIVSVITHAVSIYNLRKLQPKPVELFSSVTESIGCGCGEGLIEEVKELRSIIEEQKTKLPVPPDESHYAWRNQKEEPKVAPPSPHGPAPLPGPLERPYGFSR